MFLNAHKRFNIPATLGTVETFNKINDPATRVPDIIAFMNDSDVDVTLHFDASNNKGQVTGTVDLTAGLIITNGGNDTVLVSIDGETAVSVDLTAGSGRTLAQLATDLNTAFAAATGNTLLARAAVVGTKYLAIISGTSGPTSSVEIKTVALNPYAAIGWTVGAYAASDSYTLDIVTAITVNAKGMKTFMNPRPSSKALRIRGSASTAVTIDATTLYAYDGVQQ